MTKIWEYVRKLWPSSKALSFTFWKHFRVTNLKSTLWAQNFCQIYGLKMTPTSNINWPEFDRYLMLKIKPSFPHNILLAFSSKNKYVPINNRTWAVCIYLFSIGTQSGLKSILKERSHFNATIKVSMISFLIGPKIEEIFHLNAGS